MLNILVTKYTYFPERVGVLTGEPTAPTLEAAVLWFRHAGVFSASDQATLSVPGAGAEGVEASMEGG